MGCCAAEVLGWCGGGVLNENTNNNRNHSNNNYNNRNEQNNQHTNKNCNSIFAFTNVHCACCFHAFDENTQFKNTKLENMAILIIMWIMQFFTIVVTILSISTDIFHFLLYTSININKFITKHIESMTREQIRNSKKQ